MESSRITTEELKRRHDAHEPIAILDTRSAEAWDKSDVQLPGALRGGFNAWRDAGYPLQHKPDQPPAGDKRERTQEMQENLRKAEGDPDDAENA